ncbi:hepatocyte growth factor-regulated tyrosine kinase substrate isoform X2 [Oryctolagus cuniculus]|uniref:hepatocyte growth factor-regulated tyrosine kinase substrate isoform X2 n=1 Tax=Oryctolagus cuniculus TaxID=9986 RepID=UPI00387A1A1B
MGRGGGTFERLLDKATSQLLLETDWESILQICDLIRQGDTQAKYAVNSIKKKVNDKNPHVALYALEVMESVVKNCGQTVHDEVANKQTMEELKELLKRQVEVSVRNKILYLIQAWAHAFRNEPKYKVVQDTYQIMKVEGHVFPEFKESDAMFAAERAPDWVDAEECHRCRVQFGVVTRKHHCRACGQIFCGKCSSKYSTIPKFGIEKEVRVCEPCYEQLNKKAEGKAAAPTELPPEYLTSPLSQQSQLPPKRDETALQEEEELQLALALSQSEAEEKERLKSSYTAYPKAEPTPVASSAPPAGSLYSSPVNSSAPLAEDMDPELARYLNRNYWEKKQEEARRSPTPSAPVPLAEPAAQPGEGHAAPAGVGETTLPETDPQPVPASGGPFSEAGGWRRSRAPCPAAVPERGVGAEPRAAPQGPAERGQHLREPHEEQPHAGPQHHQRLGRAVAVPVHQQHPPPAAGAAQPAGRAQAVLRGAAGQAGADPGRAGGPERPAGGAPGEAAQGGRGGRAPAPDPAGAEAGDHAAEEAGAAGVRACGAAEEAGVPGGAAAAGHPAPAGAGEGAAAAPGAAEADSADAGPDARLPPALRPAPGCACCGRGRALPAVRPGQLPRHLQPSRLRGGLPHARRVHEPAGSSCRPLPQHARGCGRCQHGERLHVPSRRHRGPGGTPGAGRAHRQPRLLILPAHAHPRLPERGLPGPAEPPGHAPAARTVEHPGLPGEPVRVRGLPAVRHAEPHERAPWPGRGCAAPAALRGRAAARVPAAAPRGPAAARTGAARAGQRSPAHLLRLTLE